VEAYKKLIVRALRNSQVYPVAPIIDAILLDISSSMESTYHENDSYQALRQIINELSSVRVLYFNDDLIDPDTISPEYLTSFAQLQKMISGTTSLEVPLQTLRRKLPEIKKLLLVTDGYYGPSVLKSEYEITESTPSDLGLTWNDLRRGAG
jgi:hypothetical protein